VKISTYNVNEIIGRLAVLPLWLELAEPDVVCLEKLKAPVASLPRPPSAILVLTRSGMDKELERRCDPEPDPQNPREPLWPARRVGMTT
jgi:hypothetical protein